MEENIYEKYLELLNKKKSLEEDILNCQIKMYEKHQTVFDQKDLGKIQVEDNGFKLIVTKKESVKIDQDKAAALGFGFSVKYSLDKKAYKELDNVKRQMVDGCLTTSYAKPSFEVERL